MFYTFSNAEKTELHKVLYKKDLSSLKSLYQPLHGRLIHNVIAEKIDEIFDIVFTASEDTKINLFLYNKAEKNIQFLVQSSKHAGAIREIIILSKSKKFNLITFKNRKIKAYLYEYYIYSVGALSQSFINKFIILFDENKNYLTHDLEFIYDMTVDNHIRCSDKKIENKNSLSYFQNLKKEKAENNETRIMGAAKIKIKFEENQHHKTYFACAINTLAHCEMSIIRLNINNDYIKKYNIKAGDPEFEVFRKCKKFKNDQFIGLTVKIINLSDEILPMQKSDLLNVSNNHCDNNYICGSDEDNNKDLYHDYCNVYQSSVETDLSALSRMNIFMLIGLTNGNLLIVNVKSNYDNNSISIRNEISPNAHDININTNLNNTKGIISNYKNKYDDYLCSISFSEKIFKIHEAGINDLVINKKANLIATCGEDNTIAVLKYFKKNIGKALLLFLQVFNFISILYLNFYFLR